MICFRRDGWVGFLKRAVGMICFGAAFSVVFPGNTIGQTNRTVIPAQINRNIESIKPASVQIDPKIHSAEQGEVVEFSCQASGFDIVGWNWSVGNLKGSDPVFRVNTKALQPGSYIVILTVVDSQKQTMKTRAQLTVNEQTSFEVQIDPKIQSVEQGEVVEFSCQSSGAEIVGWNWSVGDQKGGDPVFRVNTESLKPGSYTVSLSVVDSRQQTRKTKAKLTVEARTPSEVPLEVQIDPKIHSVEQGEVVEFLCRSSGAEIVGWNWSVGDQKGRDPEFRVNTESLKPGSYIVSLSVVDSRQQTRKSRAQLIVKARTPSEVPLEVQIDPKIHSVEQGEVVEFLCRSSGAEIVGWNWTVGDQRGNDPEFRVNTELMQPDNYTVSLTVADSRQQTRKATARLVVKARTLSEVPLEVRIDPEIHSVEQGEVVEFFCRSSGAEIVGWKWTVGDQKGRDPEFRINTESLQPDSYTVSLTVADSRQQTRKATARLVVKEREISSPEIFLAATPNPGKVNEKINFHLSINTWPEGAYCRLDFGDETMKLQPVNEEERNIAHTYRKSGNYMVKAEIRSETDRIISAGSVEIVIEAEAVAWKMMIIPVIAIGVMSLAVYLLRSRFSNNVNKQKEKEDSKSSRDASSAMEIKVKPDLIGTQEIESSSQKTLRTCMSIRVRVDPGTQEIIPKPASRSEL